jgi:hypothetical protein
MSHNITVNVDNIEIGGQIYDTGDTLEVSDNTFSNLSEAGRFITGDLTDDGLIPGATGGVQNIYGDSAMITVSQGEPGDDATVSIIGKNNSWGAGNIASINYNSGTYEVLLQDSPGDGWTQNAHGVWSGDAPLGLYNVRANLGFPSPSVDTIVKVRISDGNSLAMETFSLKAGWNQDACSLSIFTHMPLLAGSNIGVNYVAIDATSGSDIGNTYQPVSGYLTWARRF